MGIVRDVEVLCGQTKYPADFLVLGSPQDSFCPIIFGRPFLNIVNAKIDCKKNVVTIGLDDMVHEFNFSEFSKKYPTHIHKHTHTQTLSFMTSQNGVCNCL